MNQGNELGFSSLSVTSAYYDAGVVLQAVMDIQKPT